MPNNEQRREMFESRVRAIDAGNPGYAEKWRAFESIVLKDGGYAIVPRFDPDPFIDALIERGLNYSDGLVFLKPGTERECHINSCKLWEAGEAAAIGSGYGLSEDGLWREHSWAWDFNSRIIETTERRCSYFGLRFEGEDARHYSDWIIGTGRQP
jgi:hypothetical protein